METGKIQEAHMSSFMTSLYYGDLMIKQESSLSKPLTSCPNDPCNNF